MNNIIIRVKIRLFDKTHTDVFENEYEFQSRTDGIDIIQYDIIDSDDEDPEIARVELLVCKDDDVEIEDFLNQMEYTIGGLDQNTGIIESHKIVHVRPLS